MTNESVSRNVLCGAAELLIYLNSFLFLLFQHQVWAWTWAWTSSSLSAASWHAAWWSTARGGPTLNTNRCQPLRRTENREAILIHRADDQKDSWQQSVCFCLFWGVLLMVWFIVTQSKIWKVKRCFHRLRQHEAHSVWMSLYRELSTSVALKTGKR